MSLKKNNEIKWKIHAKVFQMFKLLKKERFNLLVTFLKSFNYMTTTFSIIYKTQNERFSIVAVNISKDISKDHFDIAEKQYT